MTKHKIEKSLGEAREKLSGMKGVLDDSSETTLVGVVAFLKTLEAMLLDIDKVDQEIALALSMLEDAEIVDDAQDHTEHVFRALKHLGVQGLDAFTDADMRMAMEQTEGL